MCLNAVWQHVETGDRAHAFRTLVSLLKPFGLLVITLRHRPDDGRSDHPVSLGEVFALSANLVMRSIRVVPADDPLGRSGITWTNLVLR